MTRGDVELRPECFEREGISIINLLIRKIKFI